MKVLTLVISVGPIPEASAGKVLTGVSSTHALLCAYWGFLSGPVWSGWRPGKFSVISGPCLVLRPLRSL